MLETERRSADFGRRSAFYDLYTAVRKGRGKEDYYAFTDRFEKYAIKD